MAKTFGLSFRKFIGTAWPVVLACVGLVAIAPLSQASLIGTVPVTPGSTVFPGLVPTGTSPGTLLADETEDYSYSTSSGTTSGTVESAVFMESTGTLDFYYQIDNNGSSATSIARLSNTDFSVVANSIALGFRTDGSSLTGTGFTNSANAPITGDECGTPACVNNGSVVGFDFNPPPSFEIAPGTDSAVLVISTDATLFTNGNTELLDGGSQTLAAFQPKIASVTTPEPMSFLLLGGGLILFAGISRFRRT